MPLSIKNPETERLAGPVRKKLGGIMNDGHCLGILKVAGVGLPYPLHLSRAPEQRGERLVARERLAETSSLFNAPPEQGGYGKPYP